ncbi:MAG: glutamate-1-semialdehyde-2,1-aminomutase [Epulopiscium sp. Nele67-Bin005]|nr:MAG: glutamate-1-semialdehyde-2,1-aminomutase [Epulopiscium sp. Nele67-Bin005]
MNKSNQLFEKANQYIPAGVNSPIRAFQSVGCSPIFIKKAQGSIIEDVDNNQYIDYICSFGPLILGHSNPAVLEGINDVLSRGTSYGGPTEVEIDMAQIIVEAYSCIDKVRMVNSGTEATMSTIRVARGFTNRTKILKFEGCYHGHSDALLVKAGSGAITYGVPTSLGVPDDIVKDTIVCKYNDVNELIKIFEQYQNEIACVIVEPIGANMGVVPATKEFLTAIRTLTTSQNTILIFDEVITGFRTSFGGSYFGVEPDMICFGKIIGGGMPVGAYGGKKNLMDIVAPLGGVYQAGTLSGNSLAMHMGKNQLLYLKNNPKIYCDLDEKARYLQEGIYKNLRELNLKYTVNRESSLVCLFFTEQQVNNFEDANTSKIDIFNKYFKFLLEQGILIGPSQFEAMFLSTEHTKEQLDKTIEAIGVALEKAHQ